MITSFNPENKVQFELYSHLFAQVYKELKEKKPESLTEAEIAAGRFTSLDDYFAHAGDILELNVPRYIMLPLDETAEGIFEEVAGGSLRPLQRDRQSRFFSQGRDFLP